MTDQTVWGVVVAAQAAIKTNVTKIQNAPSYSSESRIAVPTTICIPTNIRMVTEAGYRLTWFDLMITVVVPKGSGESALTWLADIPQSIGNVFRDDVTIAGTCQTYEGDVVAVFIDDPVLAITGYRFTVEKVKISG